MRASAWVLAEAPEAGSDLVELVLVAPGLALALALDELAFSPIEEELAGAAEAVLDPDDLALVLRYTSRRDRRLAGARV